MTQTKQRAAQTFGLGPIDSEGKPQLLLGLFRVDANRWEVQAFDLGTQLINEILNSPYAAPDATNASIMVRGSETLCRSFLRDVIGADSYAEQEFNSVPVKEQKTGYGPVQFTDKDGKDCRIMAYARHDDEADNGHNLFMLTGMIQTYLPYKKIWMPTKVGPIHTDIREHFPHLEPIVKWHLCTAKGPLHYLVNTIVSIKQGQLDYARKWAVWPDATDLDLTLDDESEFKRRMMDRLPDLMREFRTAILNLGFSF